MRRRVLVLLLLALAAAPSALAQGGGRLVARDGDVTLRARFDGHRNLCLDLEYPNGGSESCGPPPASAFGALLVVPSGDELPPAAGAAPAEVAAVELDTADGPVRVQTVAVNGFAQRFFFVPAARDVTLVRLFDAAGTLVAAVDPEGDLREPDAQVVVRRAHGVRAVATLRQVLAPTLLQLDRRVPQICVDARARSSSSSLCTTPDTPADLLATSVPGCGARPGLVSALAAERVARVEAVLGDGRRVAAATRALPAAFGAGTRAVALPYPRRLAVRSVTGLDAAGAVVERLPLGIAPGAARCPRGGSGSSYGDLLATEPEVKPAGPVQVAATLGTHHLLVADAATAPALCVDADREPQTCAVPSPDPTFTALQRRGDLVFGVLPARVATVRIPLRGGGHRDVATSDGGGYTGPYRGAARFLLADLPARAGAADVALLDASGRRLGRAALFPELRLAKPETLIAGRRFVLVARRALGLGRHSCLAVGGTEAFGCLEGTSNADTTVIASVTCRPRAAVLHGTLARRVASVTVLLADGRELPAAIATVPRRLGAGRVWALAVPRGATVRAVRLGPSGRRVTLRVAPAARQCGYLTAPF